jgi:hypothetical protein
MAKFKKLTSSNGSSEVNVDGVSYPVIDGVVAVPESAVESLTHIAGFHMEPESEPVPNGKVRVVHGSAASCSWNGETYEADENGHFIVPCAAIADLSAHGFVGHEASVPAPVETAIPTLKLPAA